MTRLQGYALVIGATTLWAVNGSVSKVILGGTLDSLQLTEVRVTLGFAVLGTWLLLTRPHVLRVTAREAGYLVVFGIAGLTAVQLFYFLALEKLPIGISLLVEYTAPVLVALYARFALGERAGRSLWAGIALVLLGLALMVDVSSGGGSLSGIGLTFAFMAALAYALYILMTEHVIERRPPVATICWGFGVSAVFWAFVQPWWRFPFGAMTASHSLHGRLDGVSLPGWALIAFVVVLGTVLPFGMLVTSLHALPAARVTLLATFEPVAAAVVAWLWLEETLTASQLAGGALVLAGILAAEAASALQNPHEDDRFPGRSKGV